MNRLGAALIAALLSGGVVNAQKAKTFSLCYPFANLLFRQADLPAQSVQARVAAQQRKSWIDENVPSHPNRTQRNHAIQSFERAVLVAQSGEDDRFRQGPRHNGRDSLRVLAAAGLRIGNPK